MLAFFVIFVIKNFIKMKYIKELNSFLTEEKKYEVYKIR